VRLPCAPVGTLGLGEAHGAGVWDARVGEAWGGSGTGVAWPHAERRMAISVPDTIFVVAIAVLSTAMVPARPDAGVA